MIDWQSSATDILFNPRMPAEEQQKYQEMLENFSLESHFWAATSGSTTMKWAALSKTAVLSSAKAVNYHLQATSKDIWIRPLPEFHVGGLGILARAYLSCSQVVDASHVKWDPSNFCEMAISHQATLTALVPTQVYDLVSGSFSAPASLRAVIVGGGSLSPSLYRQAVSLGWKLLPSYGLTECCSQVATASLGTLAYNFYPELTLLNHVEVRLNEKNLLAIKSPSLLTGYAYFTPDGPYFVDPKQDGWFQTDDKGIMQNGNLTVLGRIGGFIKIGGESVDLNRLEHILEKAKLDVKFNRDAALIAVPDDRLGHVIHLVATARDIHELETLYNAMVLPFEKIRMMHFFECIPRTPLNKIIKSDILKMIENSHVKL